VDIRHLPKEFCVPELPLFYELAIEVLPVPIQILGSAIQQFRHVSI